MKQAFIIVITLITFIGCSSRKSGSSNTIELTVSVKYTGEVGYGSIYECAVKEVVSGKFYDSSINLVVLATDTDIDKYLSEADTDVNLNFSVNKKDEQYSLLPITGFVDSDKKSWLLVH